MQLGPGGLAGPVSTSVTYRHRSLLRFWPTYHGYLINRKLAMQPGPGGLAGPVSAYSDLPTHMQT